MDRNELVSLVRSAVLQERGRVRLSYWTMLFSDFDDWESYRRPPSRLLVSAINNMVDDTRASRIRLASRELADEYRASLLDSI